MFCCILTFTKSSTYKILVSKIWVFYIRSNIQLRLWDLCICVLAFSIIWNPWIQSRILLDSICKVDKVWILNMENWCIFKAEIGKFYINKERQLGMGRCGYNPIDHDLIKCLINLEWPSGLFLHLICMFIWSNGN